MIRAIGAAYEEAVKNAHGSLLAQRTVEPGAFIIAASPDLDAVKADVVPAKSEFQIVGDRSDCAASAAANGGFIKPALESATQQVLQFIDALAEDIAGLRATT